MDEMEESEMEWRWSCFVEACLTTGSWYELCGFLFKDEANPDEVLQHCCCCCSCWSCCCSCWEDRTGLNS